MPHSHDEYFLLSFIKILTPNTDVLSHEIRVAGQLDGIMKTYCLGCRFFNGEDKITRQMLPGHGKRDAL